MAALAFDKHFCPANDVVFAIVFGDTSMFARLAHAVTGQEIDVKGNVFTQATLRGRSVELETIRFDTFAELSSHRFITLDMERSRSNQIRLHRRQVYYTAAAITKQGVNRMAYEDLKPVNVVFVLTKPDYPYPIQEVGLIDRKTYEEYDDLMNITVVYINTVIREYDKSSDLYVFARYFAISSQEDAEQFTTEYENTGLGKELIRLYNTSMASRQKLFDLEQSPYFTSRLTEAQLAEERRESESKGELRKARAMARILRDSHVDMQIIVSSSGLSEDEIMQL